MLNFFVNLEIFSVNYYLNYNKKLIFEESLNFSLLNGIINIHPLIITLIYVCFYLFIFVKKNKNKNLLEKYINQFNLIKFKLLIYSFLAVTLGGYWAFQETNWGGWWNWDVVELNSLNIFLFILLLIHTFKKNIFLNSFLVNTLFKIIFLSFFIIRTDLIFSIHNFIGSNLLNDIKLYYFFLYWFIFFIYIIIFFNIKKNYYILLKNILVN